MNHDAAPGCDVAACQAVIAELTKRRPGFISTSQPVREQHGRGEGMAPLAPPAAVAFAQSADDVVAAVCACAAHNVPVIPHGAGTSLEGHVCAVRGGVALDMTGMNRIVAVRPEDMDCTVEAGVTREALNAHLRDAGLHFPIDPGANATLGGMAATRASGTNAVRYGDMRQATLALKVVTPDGALLSTGRRVRKSSAGYDLTRLFVGSEGTLGVIVELSLRLNGIPESAAVALCRFSSVEEAVSAAAGMIQAGIGVARLELLDDTQIRASNAYSKLSLPEQPTLLCEFHGSVAGVTADAEAAETISLDFGGSGFEWSSAPEERARLWKARHAAYYAAKAMRAGATAAITDVCVPISQLAPCIGAAKHMLAEHALLGAIFGHVGDGNFHVVVLVDEGSPEEVARFEQYNDQLVDTALKVGGTCTGEHGIGLGKRAKLAQEADPGALALMRAIKQTLDPRNIMNPGKVFL